MSDRIHYTTCPACASAGITNVLQVKDYTVSGEVFTIAECGTCTLRFTQDVPAIDAIAPYYKSENYISHTNISRGFINRLYHGVRKRTIRAKRKLLQKVTGKTTGKLLDLGSGTGAFVHEMKGHQWETTGLEPDAGARKVAQQLYGVELSATTRFFELPHGYFDAITLWHVLEHVHDLDGYIRQLKTILHANGKIFIAVPNYTSGDAATYKAHWAAYDVPRHLYHFSPLAMQLLMEKHGLKIIAYLPMWYDSFYISLVSNKYKGEKDGKPGNTNWINACWNGLRSNIIALGNKKRCSSVIYIITK